MSLWFVILCWISLGITALYWLRFETITMWICRPHYWWETEAAAISMTLCVAVFTLCATFCFVKNLLDKRRTSADVEFEALIGSKIKND